MAMSYHLDPYDPCPCGSGKKYKFCCAEKAKGNRHGKFPLGTIAYYGPDDKTITKIAAGVILQDGYDPIIERWTSTTVATDPKVAEEIKKFFARHGVKNVAISDGVLGCPHEQPDDFPIGQECPFCPFWAGKQGIRLASEDDEDLEEDDLEDDEDDHEDWDSDEGDESGEDSELEDTNKLDNAIDRIEAIIGDPEMDRDEASQKILAHLQANLQLPCEVNGIEDFQWEERYVFGGWDPKEYRLLKKTQPSYRDRYQLLRISEGAYSEWKMFGEGDLDAYVRRNSEGKEFVLGLSELKATDKKSTNYRLIQDYAIWCVNSR